MAKAEFNPRQAVIAAVLVCVLIVLAVIQLGGSKRLGLGGDRARARVCIARAAGPAAGAPDAPYNPRGSYRQEPLRLRRTTNPDPQPDTTTDVASAHTDGATTNADASASGYPVWRPGTTHRSSTVRISARSDLTTPRWQFSAQTARDGEEEVEVAVLGEVLDGTFIICDIGLESVEIGFVGYSEEVTTRVPLSDR